MFVNDGLLNPRVYGGRCMRVFGVQIRPTGTLGGLSNLCSGFIDFLILEYDYGR